MLSAWFKAIGFNIALAWFMFATVGVLTPAQWIQNALGVTWLLMVGASIVWLWFALLAEVERKNPPRRY